MPAMTSRRTPTVNTFLLIFLLLDPFCFWLTGLLGNVFSVNPLSGNWQLKCFCFFGDYFFRRDNTGGAAEAGGAGFLMFIMIILSAGQKT
jgi:hypothetical protein